MGIEEVLLIFILASVATNFFVYCCFAYIPFDDDDDDDDGDDEEEMIRGGEVRGLKAKELKKIMEFTHKDRVWGETECTICLEKIETGERCRFLQGCGHVFHKVCADMWLRRKATCPTCRAVVVPVSVGIEQIM